MALLVNYEGTYLPPQKLWYLIDGVWKEVVNVFENPVQQEVAVLDQERIKQDQVVSALITKEADLLARIDGSNPSVALETDPAQIEVILNEIDTIELQLTITKTEQVVLTKKLFEAKAQMEYLKLVTEGEQALERIAKQVIDPAEWRVIRIAPQSTLDERLEVVIQHGLDTNDKIFNYGLVYYRLIKLNSTDLNDNVTYLKDQFKRRLNKVAFDLGTEPTNYIFTIDDIQTVYIEVNQFVNSGAQRIGDYLSSIKDQQKFILDNIEEAKAAMVSLQNKANDGLIPLVNGKIITNTTSVELQVPLGDTLLAFQNVTTFDKLVSTQTLQDIVAGTKNVADYPGIVKLNSDATALNEKIVAIQDFTTLNTDIQSKLVTGDIAFNLQTVSTMKTDLATSQQQFWNSALGSTSLSVSGGTPVYTQTYTSGGMYRFKSDELVTLSTALKYIISVLETTKQETTLMVTSNRNYPVEIISVVNGKVTITTSDDIKTDLTSKQYAISNVSETTVMDMNLSNNLEYAALHPAISFVSDNNAQSVDSILNMNTYHPDITVVKETTVSNFDPNDVTDFAAAEYLNAFYILQFQDYMTISEIPFNTSKVPLELNNDNIISYMDGDVNDAPIMVFNTSKVPLELNNDNIISYMDGNDAPIMVFNTSKVPLELNNDNIISYMDGDVNDAPIMVFNTSKVPSYHINGYAQSTKYTSAGILNGIQIVEFTNCDIYYPTINIIEDVNYKNLQSASKSNNSVVSQTGLNILENENIIINTNLSEIYIASSMKNNILEENVFINRAGTDTVSTSANTLSNVIDQSVIVNKSKDALSISAQLLTNTYISNPIIDKTVADNKVIGKQMNTSVIIN